MKKIKLLFIIFLLIVFLAGIYFIFNMKKPETIKKENMENKQNEPKNNCPNLLIKKGNVLLLFNTDLPNSDTNPIPFYSLDEYINYLEIQRRNGTICPVLFLQQENDVQGKDIYRIRPSPFDQQGGLPTITDINNSQLSKQIPLNDVPINTINTSRDSSPYNKNNYPSFDPHGQHVGVYTDLDDIHLSTEKTSLSDNPMDTNWGGVEYTQKMVDDGKYIDYNITKPMLYQPKTAFNPIFPNIDPPKDII